VSCPIERWSGEGGDATAKQVQLPEVDYIMDSHPEWPKIIEEFLLARIVSYASGQPNEVRPST
jgi:hypothetical protein